MIETSPRWGRTTWRVVVIDDGRRVVTHRGVVTGGLAADRERRARLDAWRAIHSAAREQFETSRTGVRLMKGTQR